MSLNGQRSLLIRRGDIMSQAVKPEDIWADWIDDSMMPSAEEAAKYKKDPEVEERLQKAIDAIAHEFGLY